MQSTNEAISRVIIDSQLTAQGWSLADGFSVRYEVVLEDGTRADYVLCDRHGRSLAVIEAKRFSISPGDAAEQAKNYARQLKVPYIFLANGNEIYGRTQNSCSPTAPELNPARQYRRPNPAIEYSVQVRRKC